MRLLKPALIAAFFMATAVLAHTGVKDPQVKARMDGMKLLSAQTKILDQMVKGVMPFDPAKALTAIEKMQAEAKRTPTLFEPKADDPKSEARPEIWTDWDSFTARSITLSDALATAEVTTPDALGQSVRAIGAACSACHKQFRE